jgi:hypothetical protein
MTKLLLSSGHLNDKPTVAALSYGTATNPINRIAFKKIPETLGGPKKNQTTPGHDPGRR